MDEHITVVEKSGVRNIVLSFEAPRTWTIDLSLCSGMDHRRIAKTSSLSGRVSKMQSPVENASVRCCACLGPITICKVRHHTLWSETRHVTVDQMAQVGVAVTKDLSVAFAVDFVGYHRGKTRHDQVHTSVGWLCVNLSRGAGMLCAVATGWIYVAHLRPQSASVNCGCEEHFFVLSLGGVMRSGSRSGRECVWLLMWAQGRMSWRRWSWVDGRM